MTVPVQNAANAAPCAPTLGSGRVAGTALAGSLLCGNAPTVLPGTGRAVVPADCACATGDIIAAAPIATPATRPIARSRRTPAELAILDTRRSPVVAPSETRS